MIKYEISKLNLKELYANENAFMFDLENALAPISYKTLVCDVISVYSHISKISKDNILIFVEDTYWFFVFMIATSYTNKAFYVPGSSQELYIKDIATDDMLYITDNTLAKGSLNCPIVDINSIIDSQADLKYIEEFICQNAKQNIVQNSKMRFVFFTSGSTGKPKFIEKRFDYLDFEAQCLARAAYEKANISIFTTTAAHYHLYGFTHAMLQPFLFGAPFLRKKITFVESLNNLKDFKLITLITTPGFLKRIDENSITIDTSWYIVSGTEVLHQDTFDMVKDIFKTEVFEFYGSTETGVVARKIRKEGVSFKAFDEVDIALSESGELMLKALYTNDEYICVGDLAQIKDGVYFTLLGRANDIVKVDGKRIGLSDINIKICENELVKNGATILGKRAERDIVVSFIVPKKADIMNTPYRERTHIIQKYAYEYFDRGVAPKKVIFLDEIPLSAAGKVDNVLLRAYAQKNTIQNRYSFSLISKYNNNLEVLVNILEDSVFFDGHFDSKKIFPALAQVELIRDICSCYYCNNNTNNAITQIKKMKFVDTILPKEKFILSIKHSDKKDNKIEVKLYNGEKIFSKGSMVYA